MGLNDLWSHIAGHWQDVEVEHLKGKTLAVDGQVWLHECNMESLASKTALLTSFYYRCKNLLDHGIQPYILFDESEGAMSEQCKSSSDDGEEEMRKRPGKVDKSTRDKYIKQHISNHERARVKELLHLMGIGYTLSVDNEAAAAYLEEGGRVHGFLSPHLEYFLYGGNHLYHMVFEGGGIHFPIRHFQVTTLVREFGLNRNRLVALALLLGCDYMVKGIAGIGFVTAIEILSEFSISEDDHPMTILDRFRSYCSHEIPVRKGDSAVKKKLRKAEFAFPPAFPNSEEYTVSVNAYFIPHMDNIPIEEDHSTGYDAAHINELLSSSQKQECCRLVGRGRKRAASSSVRWSKREWAAISILRSNIPSDPKHLQLIQY